jgi:hypothetical protein
VPWRSAIVQASMNPQLEAARQYIANPGRTLDRGAPRLQRGDIAIDRPRVTSNSSASEAALIGCERRRPKSGAQLIGAAHRWMAIHTDKMLSVAPSYTPRR